MKSILEGRPALRKEVEKIAEVAGYLWQNGWAERNGGNITVNVTNMVDDEIRNMPAISGVMQIGTSLPALKGAYFSVRELASACATLPDGRWRTVQSSGFSTTVRVM